MTPIRRHMQSARSARPRPAAMAGFTLFEVLAVLAVLAVLFSVFSDMLSPVMNWTQKRDTSNRLAAINAAFVAAINDNALAFANNTNATVLTLKGTINPAAPGTNGRCAGGTATFAPLQKYLPSAPDAWHDGFGRAFCIYVSPQLSSTFNGVSFTYHSVAVVSGGVDGAIDASTQMAADGTMNVGGDDISSTINGQLVIGQMMQGTWQVMSNYATALQSYYQARYSTATVHDPLTDYWANASPTGSSTLWDTSSSMPGVFPPTSGCSAPGSAVSGPYLLGFAQSDVTTPFGTSLYIDNCSAQTRNPENPTSFLAIAPYSVILTAQIPGPVPSITKTVLGITQ